jgi:serine/threonine protein kinase
MSSPSGNWFGKVFKKNSQPEPKHNPAPLPRTTPQPATSPTTLYKKGDLIGEKYKVFGILGMGGFGVVYKVYSRELSRVFALKTYRDEYLVDQEVKKRFHKEASVWVELGSHPYLVHANHVEEVSGRLFILMEFIAPNEEGLNSLEGYLQRRPPNLAQSLRWAIQICLGMEYAYSKGIRAHRDLKPANIMISQDKTVKITDFGLARVLGELPAIGLAGPDAQVGQAAITGQTMQGAVFGTPTHMAPEQFENAAGCDQQSDIYSFGVILFQLASGGGLPFLATMPMGVNRENTAAIWQEYQRLHNREKVPHLDNPLMPIIEQCLAKRPGDRYPSFEVLRSQLELLLKEKVGQTFLPARPETEKVLDLAYRGLSLNKIGRYQEALACYERAIASVPDDSFLWRGKGAALEHLGRNTEALACFEQAIKVDPTDAVAWNCKGAVLGRIGRFEEALACLDRALDITPNDADTLCNKANTLSDLGRFAEAITYAEQSVHLAPRHAAAWTEKGRGLHALGQLVEAV